MVALTRGEAQQAIAEGAALERQVAEAAQISDAGQLDKALAACKQVRRVHSQDGAEGAGS